MPYDPSNPFYQPDPFAVAVGAVPPPQPQQRQAPSLPPISPQDEQSLLSKIGSAGMGGLAWLGGMLNKPGRVIRGALGGHFDELGNIIPFSDALGITNPEREVRGQDLIGADKDTPFLSPQGIAGFGLDVLTDPLTYMSFGGSALTKLGKAAEAAHVLPPTVAGRLAGVAGEAAEKLAAKTGQTAAEVAGQRLGGHLGLGLPFMGNNLGTYDLGPLGNAIKSGVNTAASYVPGGSATLDAAGRVAGAAGDLYRQTIPPLFESAVMGRKTAAGQQVAREISAGVPEAIARANQEAMPMAQHAMLHGLDTPEAAAALRQAGETGVGVTPEMAGILNPMKESLAERLPQQQGLGMPTHELTPQAIRQGVGEGDNLGYLPRESVQPEQTGLAYLKSKTVAPVEAPGRKDWTTGLTTDSLNRLKTEDLSISGSTMNAQEQVAKTIGDKYLNIPKQQAEVDRLQSLIHDDMAAHQGVVTNQSLVGHLKDAQAVQTTLEAQARELAKMKVSGSLPEFLNHPVVDFAKKTARDNINMLKAQASYNGLAKAVVPAGEDTVPIMDAIKGLWHPQDYISGAGGAPTGAQASMQAALDTLGVTGKLADIHVPKAVADDLAGLSRMHTINGLQEFTKVWDSATNLTKAGQTMFPSTVVRNATQDMFNKMVYGMHDPSFSAIDPRRYIQPILDFKKIANGGTVDGLAEKMQNVSAFKGLSDAQAAAKVRELYTTWDVGREGVKSTAIRDLGADVGGAARNGLEALLPISEQKGPLAAYVGGLKEGDWNPTHVAGFMGQKESAFKPVLAKQAADNASDNLMRGSSFMAKMMQGYEPEAAFQATVKAHYDYANLSQFEKGFMKRLVPFYSWSRQNIPAVVKEIAELPGGKLATAVKASVAARGEQPGFMRPDLASGVAMPLGGEENGQQRFLSRLGLGFEDLGQIAGPSDALGMLNPLLKAPLEAWSGKQFATGRDLADLHSRIGDLTGVPMPATENLLMNSPVGRLLTTAGTLADERKGVGDKALNLLTGARVQDVDQEAARRQAVRQYIQDNLHGPAISHFDELSVRPDNLPLLNPQERQLYQLYRSMQSKKPLPSAQ